jgi:Amino acid kinase family
MQIVIALGGNALLRRGQAMTVQNQQANIHTAAQAIATLAHDHNLIIVHGNGPPIGLLALQAAQWRQYWHALQYAVSLRTNPASQLRLCDLGPDRCWSDCLWDLSAPASPAPQSPIAARWLSSGVCLGGSVWLDLSFSGATFSAIDDRDVGNFGAVDCAVPTSGHWP